MKNSETSTSAPSCPYDTLHIYYLEGRVDSSRVRFKETFLGTWEEEGFSFLFFQEPSDSEVQELIGRSPGLHLIDRYQMTYEEWQGGKIVPFTVSDFLIVPPWDQDASNTSLRKKLILDPGVVFGNGAHDTTQDCLDLLSRLLKFIPLKSMIDLGTGTGLLSLAAAKYGLQKVIAIDFNFLAVKTALKNIRLNGFERQILAVQGRAETFIDMPSDLLVANIHYDVMRQLVMKKGFLEKKWFILSGLLASQADKIEQDLATLPVTILEKRDSGGVWRTFFGKVDLPYSILHSR